MMNMNNEEFDRKMAFIVEQQAQFASDIHQLQESQSRTDQVVAQTAVVVGEMGEVVTVNGGLKPHPLGLATLVVVPGVQ